MKYLHRKLAGLEPWKQNFGQGQERRGQDGVSWYDLSLIGNGIPCETDTAIIVTSWFGQLKWLKSVLAKYRESGAMVILAYDNPFYPWMERSAQNIQRCLPHQEHYVLANSVVMKHITYDADKRNGWFWDVRYAQGVINSFPNIKYVYVTNGDCICERPEGFEEVKDLLGNHEFMSGQSDESVFHTATMFMRKAAFNTIFDYMYELMKVPTIGSRSPEGMVREAIFNKKIAFLHAPQQPIDVTDGTVDFYSRYDQESTWKKILGFKNLFAIQETAWNNGLEPLDKKYLDPYEDWIYFSGDERETICKYCETGDRRYLMMWWDRGEDSDYNRLYYPVEHYGAEPIY